MGNRDAVVIELDSAPTSLGVPTSGDYLERCVVSALFRPVLRLVSATRESDYFEFVVEDGHRFSDGSPVQPEHVLQTLVASAASAQWARYIGYLERAEIVGRRLCLSSRRPARFPTYCARWTSRRPIPAASATGRTKSAAISMPNAATTT